MKRNPSVLCWNCKGAGGRHFLCEVKQLLREFRPRSPNILILMEPRISGGIADKVCKELGKR